MNEQAANAKTVTRLLFRLLPVQILLASVNSVNGIVSSYFASNYVGVEAMSAVGLYSPIGMLITSVNAILVGGSVILSGEYMGKNQRDKLQGVFSLNLTVTSLIAAIFTLILLTAGLFDLTGFLTEDRAVRQLLDRYLIGQAIGVLPLMLGGSFSSFLSLENRGKRTLTASIVYIAVNVLLNLLFVGLLHLEALGLALASSLGLWVFLGVQIQYYLSGRSFLRVRTGALVWRECGEIFRIGVPGALSNLYQTARGLIVNRLLVVFVGSVGISAFAAANNLLTVVWSIPIGMLAVSRMLISVSVGEEDRQTLADVMRVMFRRFLPLQGLVSACIILCSVPLTRIFFRDPSEPVYMMTVWGLRILPLCMPLSIIYMHFVCYGQASGKHALVHLLSFLDGVGCVAGFTALLIRSLGVNSVYIANVLNGVVTTLVIIAYAWMKKKRLPRNMDELMVIPDDFGAPPSERMDLSVRSTEEVVRVAEQVQRFCLERGVDSRRAYLAGLSMEEMAGNIVDHGFTKDRKPHSVDVRVVHKGDDVILRIKDDCVPFDPVERQKLAEGGEIGKNIGIRLIFKIARALQYQNILGLNVLTIRI
ncbi:MAG: ATP-binding protein [Oscillospiraceae bacterium]|nr:ATP-binding protein [Oscillospiraceae bacterium]